MSDITFYMDRIDGLGSRIIALMNAFFLAEYTSNSDSVKFIWKDNRPFGGVRTEDTKAGFRKETDGKVDIVGLCIENAENIFSESFLKKYCIDKISFKTISFDKPYSNIDLFREYLFKNQNSFFNAPLADLTSRSFLPNLDLSYYKSEMQQCWKKIHFSAEINKIILNAQNMAEKIGDFVVIHIRSGDGIYDYADFRKFNTQQFYHITSAELAMGIIDLNLDKEVILVGDDLKTLDVIVKYYNKNNIKTINYFRDPTKLSNLELFFFDVAFMSKALILYGTHSAVVRLANFIGNQKFINNYRVFTNEEYLSILKKYFPILKLHRCQKAYSLFSMFNISRILLKPQDELLLYLYQALDCDYDNDKYRIHIVNCLITKGDLLGAENLLKDIFENQNRGKEYIDTLFLKGWTGVVFKEVFDNYLKNATEDYPYITFIASKICEFQNDIKQSFFYIQLISRRFDKPFFLEYFNKVKQNYNKEKEIEHALYHKKVALSYIEKWKWKSAINHYQLALKYSDEYLVEFLNFLASIGQLKLLDQIISKYSYERIEREVSFCKNYYVLSIYLELYKNDIMEKKSIIYDNLYIKDVLINILKKEKISQKEELIATYCISSCDEIFSEKLDIS
ncbi:hypothetical protein R3083_001791, partial [Campylobacter coli]|nr:sugar transferase [Campylobacter coli]ELR5355723.1 hypothetical protein [Campylobacter coli]